MSDKIKELAKELCTCPHKCKDTDKCIVEDEALLLINKNKSNNLGIKSNNLPSVLTNEKNVSVKGKSVEKQIEEMAVENLVAFLWHNTNMYDDDLIFDIAEALCNAGYRKQSEGEWICHDGLSFWDGWVSGYSCSCCGVFIYTDVFEDTSFPNKFCSNCGAKMKGGEE